MNRKQSLVLSVFLIVFAIMPITAGAVDYRISPYLGTTYSMFTYDGDDLLEDYYDSWKVDEQYSFGYTTGVMFSFKTKRESRISLETGLSYQRRGGNVELILFDENEELTTRMDLKQKSDYLNFPILIKLQCIRNKIDPYLKFGAEFGFCLDASFTENGSITNSSDVTIYAKPFTRDVTDSMKNPNIELFVGIGADVPFGSRSGFVQLSYSHGLTDVNDPEGSLWDVKRYYRNVSLIFGYNFDI